MAKSQKKSDDILTTTATAGTPVSGVRATEATEPVQMRRFETQKQYTHDLYKFEVAMFKKNVAIDGNRAEYVDNEHVHWFHTITSDGKKQTRTNSVGGHFHEVEIIQQAPGQPPKVICKTGPMREAFITENGRKIKTSVPVNDIDKHKHEVTYDKSNIILERQRNQEAAKAEAAIQLRYESGNVQGVSVGED